MSFKISFFFCQCLLILFINSVSYADTKSSIETQIIDRIASSMFPSQKITVWGETAEQKYIIEKSHKLYPAENIHSARLVIVSKKVPENIPSNAILISTEYSLLAKEPRIVGAFFWQKGRPNILFIRERMEKANIVLGHEFDKYIEDEL